MDTKDTILIVDDTQANVDILIELLDDYDVMVALDGKSAIETLEYDNNVHLILLDIMMPYMDGFEVCQRLKANERTKDIPIIFLTAKTDDESIQKAFEIGGVDYVTKPFRPIELLSRVRTQITLQKQQKKMIEQNKFVAIGELMHNIAHQWRQPLSVISTSSSGMLMQKEMGVLSDENFERFCNSITEQTKYLSSTIDDLKNLLQNEKEKPSCFNIGDCISQNQVKLFSQEHLDDINFIKNIDKSLSINGNQNEFIEILYEIIKNSKDALNEQNIEQKYIFIDIKKDEDNIIVQIIDNASGIEPENLDKIFEPYFTTYHKSQGKGLGLYKVLNFLKYTFKATIDIENVEYSHNNKLQKGTKIEMVFPIN